MKKLIRGITCGIFFVMLAGCGGSGVNTSAGTTKTQAGLESQFERFLNLSAPSIGIALTGEAKTRSFALLTKGYFYYPADDAVLNDLLKHRAFGETSSFNQAFRPIKPTSSSFPKDFTYWTEDPVTAAGKDCYEGTFYPYVHYLLHDSTSGKMQHFVTQMRD